MVGEVEIVFGLWAMVLIAVMMALSGKAAAGESCLTSSESADSTEPKPPKKSSIETTRLSRWFGFSRRITRPSRNTSPPSTRFTVASPNVLNTMKRPDPRLK